MGAGKPARFTRETSEIYRSASKAPGDLDSSGTNNSRYPNRWRYSSACDGRERLLESLSSLLPWWG